jgi:short-subunit dehydrogenase involved in D-alanine esterification of teichoic acids
MLNTCKTILVTGGTSGIGRELVDQLHYQGHELVVVARNQAQLSRLDAEYARVTTYACDLSSRAQIESLATEITDRHPRLSILINNAGVQYTPTLLDEDFSFDSIEHETQVNFLSHVWITALLLPGLLQQNTTASIVNISSGLIFAPKTNSAIYCASKAAIHSFSQSLRYQLAETNILVQEVILPLVDTPMTEGRGKNKLSASEAARQIIEGMGKKSPEIYVGKAKLLPYLMRISPAIVKGILRRS